MALKSAVGEAPENALSDPDLARVVEAWPRLPEAVRRGIVAMVEAASAAGLSRPKDRKD